MNEQEIMQTIFLPLAAGFKGSLGLMDDAAVINNLNDHKLVVSKDMLISGVHFFENDHPTAIAKKSLRVNLSDIAAMGAKPICYLLGLCLPNKNNVSWLTEFCEGLKIEQEFYHCWLAGGDLVSSTGSVSISITIFGGLSDNNILLRSKAQVGDDVWVSGTIGDAGVALMLLKGRIKLKSDFPKSHRDYLEARFRLPTPRLALGAKLLNFASSACDVSDGLLADLLNICSASGLGANISSNLIPISSELKQVIKDVETLSIIDLISAGDDYELIFTSNIKHSEHILEISRHSGLRLTKIGQMTQELGLVLDGEYLKQNEVKMGYGHF